MSFPTEIIASVAVFLCLAIGIVIFVVQYQRRVINHQVQLQEFNRQKQLELMETSIHSEEQERRRIAAELHDDVGATLSSIRLFLHQVAKDPADQALIDQTRGLLDISIQKVRDISHQLQPGALAYLGLLKAMSSLAAVITRTGAIRMTVSSTEAWTDPPEHTALAMYRIVQELVNNISKHAGADRISIVASSERAAHRLVIAYNGNGMTEADYRMQLHKEGAIGLKNIESRLLSAGLAIVFEKGTGDEYRIILAPAATTR